MHTSKTGTNIKQDTGLILPTPKAEKISSNQKPNFRCELQENQRMNWPAPEEERGHLCKWSSGWEPRKPLFYQILKEVKKEKDEFRE